LAEELGLISVSRGYVSGSLIAVSELTSAVDAVLRAGTSLCMPSVIVTPRPAVKERT